MTIRVTITKPQVTDAYGIAMVVGQTYTVEENFGLSLIQSLKASDTDASLVSPGVSYGTEVNIIYVNAATLASPTAEMLRNTSAFFALDVAPFSMSRSNGTNLVSIPDGMAAEALGASSSATAAVNTTAIQAALNRTGLVTLTTPGTYLISNTLTIYNDTTFTLGSGVVIKQAPGIRKRLLQPASFASYIAGTTTTVTIAWTAGALATVTWPQAHNLTTRDYVWIQGAVQSEFNNVFRVAQVLSPTTFSIILLRTPTTTATGTIKAVVCTRNFIIDGGTWDYDIVNNDSAVNPNRDNFMLIACANFVIQNVTHLNFHRGVTSGAYADGLFRNCTYIADASTAAEGHKTFGPINGAHLHDLVIKSTDDGMSLQPKEAPAFSWTDIPFGDIYNFTAEYCLIGSIGATAAGGVVLYASDNERVENITLKNVDSYSDQGTGIVAKYGDTFTTGKINSITIENANFKTGNPTTQYPISFACPIDVLTLRNITPVNPDLVSPLIRINATATIKSFLIENLRFVNSSWPSAAASLISIVGPIETLTIKGGYCSGSGTANPIFLNIGAVAVNNIIFDGFDMENFNKAALIAASMPVVPTITVRGCRWKTINHGFDVRSTTKFVLQGNYFDTFSTAVVRSTTTTGINAQVYSGGGNVFVAAPAVISTGAGINFQVYGFDIPFNTAQTGAVATTAGQFGNNTTSASAPGLGLVISDGAAWRRAQALTQVVASSATPALDCNLGNNVTLNTGANATVTWGAPTNVPAAGEAITITMTQDATGGRNIVWNAAYIFPTAWSNTGNTSNLISEITFVSNGTKLVAQGANVWHA